MKPVAQLFFAAALIARRLGVRLVGSPPFSAKMNEPPWKSSDFASTEGSVFARIASAYGSLSSCGRYPRRVAFVLSYHERLLAETPYTISKRIRGCSMPIVTSWERSRGLSQIESLRLSTGAGLTLPMRMQNTSMPYLSAYRLAIASPNALERP